MDGSLYSFVVVDDEPEIREGIRDTIPWEALGFSFAGACANGFEALELAERVRIDAVLADINMPFMDGLTFAGRLAEIAPAAKVLIITGYDEFEYARQALRLQVYDYIVKPVTPGELRVILEKLRLALDAERAEQLNLEQIKKRLAESMPLLRERFLANLLEGKLDESHIRERIAYFELPLPTDGAAYQCLALDFARRREGENFDLDLLTWRNILERALHIGTLPALLFQDRDDRLALIAWGNDPARLYREGLKAAEQLCQNVETLGLSGVIVGVGETVERLLDLNKSYRLAVDALTAAALQEKSGVAAYRELWGLSGKPSKEPWEKRIVSALKAGDREGALKGIGDMALRFKETPFTVEEYRIQFSLLLAALMRSCEELEIPLGTIFPRNVNPFAEIDRLKSLDAARLWFSGLVEGIAGFITARQENFAQVKAREALEYLESRYADPSLSLQSLCKKLDISISYLSANLKRYHDKTFVEEVTRIRITKAMELLRTTDLLTYEIAEKVGYRDPHYFSLSFRKFTGLTTTEYRNQAVITAPENAPPDNHGG
ncbi:MAG: response regulator [Treponema sp.]|jgi:two-component system response regulator YesN|nr:response regulator [Treponema sp.]